MQDSDDDGTIECAAGGTESGSSGRLDTDGEVRRSGTTVDRVVIDVVGLVPISVNAMYRSIGRGIVMSERGKTFKNAFTTAIINNKSTKRIGGAVSVEIHFEFADKRRRDVDNYAKAVLDCAKTLLFDDDSDVWHLTMTKKIGMVQNKISIIISKNV